jgi:hypothetical protein
MVGWPLVQSVQPEHPGRVPACTHGPVRVHRYLRRRVIILATGWTQADAIASLIVVALMLKAAWELLRDSGWILLEAAPKAMGPRGYARPPAGHRARPQPARPARLDRHLVPARAVTHIVI